MTGTFIVLEGADGTGKSSLVPRLAARLRATGREVVETREPGGTALGRALRDLLLGGDAVDARSEALLMAADRAAHVATLIRPAIERGAVVISDRFLPSSLVYQGVGRNLGIEAVASINAFGSNGCTPDVVIVLDVDDATADTRRAGESDRIEREAAGFHHTVREAYRNLAHANEWPLVDATPPLPRVEESVWAIIDAALRRPEGA